MRILLTGASSFTGSWLAQCLADAGHELTLVFRGEPDGYEGIRAARVDRARRLGDAVFRCSFGDERFMETLAGADRWDLLCHHAAEVGDYRNPEFDVAGALGRNTRNLDKVLERLGERDCTRILATGSLFENGEGAGSDDLRAFSPYGLSKSFTGQLIADRARAHGMRFGKFVIGNPFGPWEEPRFGAYLFRTWFAGDTPQVRTPDYIRDNIHVSLLARAYVRFAEGLPTRAGVSSLHPSGYIESQGTFARRLAAEMEPRLGRACPLELGHQTDWSEPRIRINTDPVDGADLGWSESRAWDELAEYYLQTAAAGAAAGTSR